MEYPVRIQNLSHSYGNFKVYNNLNVDFCKGKVYGILGKNGVGKTTLIKILMGFLQPSFGECYVLGKESFALTPEIRARIALLFEGHLAYGFFNITQIEQFYAQFYPKWDAHIYYDLVARLRLPKTHKVGNMSEGQRSQVVLGLLLAQNAELLILDDYSMGLDAGYRSLFVEYFREYLRTRESTTILTSHIISNMESFVDEVLFLQKGGVANMYPLKHFVDTFKCFFLPYNTKDYTSASAIADKIKAMQCVKNVEIISGGFEIYGFMEKLELQESLNNLLDSSALQIKSMDLENAFIGYTGRY